MTLTQEEAHRLFEYKDGELFWKERPRSDFKSDLAWKQWNPKHVGKRAGCWSSHHVAVSINKKSYQLARIVFLMHYGSSPEIVDHADCNPMNNHISNLRAATKADNQRNAGMYAHNKSGIKGVSWHKAAAKWHVQIKVKGVKKYLGIYEDIDLAELVAQEARNKFHGNFANHGLH
jgi:hypothetical protein